MSVEIQCDFCRYFVCKFYIDSVRLILPSLGALCETAVGVVVVGSSSSCSRLNRGRGLIWL